MGCCQSNKNLFKVKDTDYLGNDISLARLSDLKEIYDVHAKCLGEGSYGKVFLANKKSNIDDKVAIKVISKRGLDKFLIQCMINEVKILNKVDHPNIVKYYETYDEKQYIYMVMEYCSGGDLYHKIIYDNPDGMKEKEASVILLKIV